MFIDMGRKLLSVFLMCAFLMLVCSPAILESQAKGKANLIGFIFDQDGTTPVEGAVIKVQNIDTRNLFESGKSDAHGIFKIADLERGLYLLGVSTSKGDANAEAVLGITGTETAKVSVTLKPLDQEVAKAIQDVYKEQKEKGESRIGHVVNPLSQGKEADVFIEKGLIQLGDRVHVKGPQTDFFQEIKNIKVAGSIMKRAFAGQNAVINVIKNTEPGDVVYVACKKGIPPIFLTPLGIAAIVASAGAITYGTISLLDEMKASGDK